MKLTTPLALALLACSPVRADTVQDEVAALEAKRTVGVARATTTVNQRYLRDYEGLLQRANILGDAQGANLVRAVIRQLTPEPVSAAKTDPVPDVKPLPDVKTASASQPDIDPEAVLTANLWMEDSEGEKGRTHHLPMAFLPGGEMKSRDHGWSGTWKIEDKQLVVEINAYPGEYRKYALPVQLRNWPGVGRKSTLTGVPKVNSAETDAFLKEGKRPAGATKPAAGEQPGYFGKSGS